MRTNQKTSPTPIILMVLIGIATVWMFFNEPPKRPSVVETHITPPTNSVVTATVRTSEPSKDGVWWYGIADNCDGYGSSETIQFIARAKPHNQQEYEFSPSYGTMGEQNGWMLSGQKNYDKYHSRKADALVSNNKIINIKWDN
jgi:hypothetical protein